jgi:hypothetical protein
VRNLISSAEWIIGLGLIPYAIAVLMPSWRWLLGVTLIVGGVLSALWIQHWIASSAPDYHEGAGGALGIAFVFVITLAFATGVIVRAFTMLLAAKGLPLRHVFTICVVGFAIVPAIFIVPGAWHDWNMRPPSEACSNTTFHIKVANVDFAIPAAPIFIVYLGKRSNQDAYYFSMNPSLRTFCSLSDNGRQPIKATNIWLRFGRYRETAPTICTDPVPDWAKTYCAADGSAKPTQDDSIDFPLDIHVFAPDEVTMGEFGGSRSTYDDSLQRKPWPNAPVFIKSDSLTPDQHPLTFECNENGNDDWCKTSYPWSDGANLNYSFRSRRDDVATRGRRVDVETRKFLSGFTAQR